MQMKTYQDWNTASTLTSYLNPEDEIDQEMVNYFCKKLPPQTMTSTVIQIGKRIIIIWIKAENDILFSQQSNG